MNTVKNIKIATGLKRIELGDENFALLQIREVLKEHRETLINRLISDLSTYINYTFSTPPTREQLEQIKDKLISLKHATISLPAYSEIIGEVLANETTHVRSEPFYQEINTVIGEALNPSQLILVR
jgi:hypothetical protein